MSEAKRLSECQLSRIRSAWSDRTYTVLEMRLIDHISAIESELAAAKAECDARDRRIHDLEMQLATARSERIELARIYDPNCDEYDYETQAEAMKGAAQTVDAMQELAKAVGMDPEGCLVDVPDKVLGELEAANAECERLRVFERAMESMAAQMIHPKMTALEMANMQLEEPTP